MPNIFPRQKALNEPWGISRCRWSTGVNGPSERQIGRVDWSGRVVDVVGIAIGDRGRSCEEHDICGRILHPDVLVRFVKEEIMVEGKIEVAISVYWVTDSVERCRVDSWFQVRTT